MLILWCTMNKQPSGASFIDYSHSWRLHSHDPITFQRPPALGTSPWGILAHIGSTSVYCLTDRNRELQTHSSHLFPPWNNSIDLGVAEHWGVSKRLVYSRRLKQGEVVMNRKGEIQVICLHKTSLVLETWSRSWSQVLGRGALTKCSVKIILPEQWQC
jgi:hypothetical protein